MDYVDLNAISKSLYLILVTLWTLWYLQARLYCRLKMLGLNSAHSWNHFPCCRTACHHLVLFYYCCCFYDYYCYYYCYCCLDFKSNHTALCLSCKSKSVVYACKEERTATLSPFTSLLQVTTGQGERDPITAHVSLWPQEVSLHLKISRPCTTKRKQGILPQTNKTHDQNQILKIFPFHVRKG